MRRSTCAHLLRKRLRRQSRQSLLRSASQARAFETSLTVVGSINLDLVTRVRRLPRPGETLSGATLERVPGGKGANQAVAAARLGSRVRMVGCVGADPVATIKTILNQAAYNANFATGQIRTTNAPDGKHAIGWIDDGRGGGEAYEGAYGGVKYLITPKSAS